MLTDYIQAAMRRAKYEILPDDNSYYGEIPGFQGVWANAQALEDCRKELQEVLEEWLMFKMYDRLALPIVDGIELKIPQMA